MIERRCGPRLAAKAFQGARVLGYIRGKELEGNEPAELRILGLVDHTHPAAAQFLDDAVVRNGLADHVLRGANKRGNRRRAYTASQ